jgi:hypothetical protein
MSPMSIGSENVTLAPAVGSVWEQEYPAMLRGIRVTVTDVKVEDGVVWVESAEPAFPTARVWLELPRWVDFFRQVS